MLTLGIETSCDETACSVVLNGKRILSNVIATSLEDHKPYGGVIPEIACRSHVESIAPVLEESLRKAKVSLDDIQLIASTYGPGLPGSLLVGLSTAKAISFAKEIPLVGVDHIQAHLYACLMVDRPPSFPLMGLVISGGHTSLFWMKDFHRFKRIAETQDDACGEAFDKVAKMLELGYPGGPLVEKRAREGNPQVIPLPLPKLNEPSLDFSFSGIKTAVLYKVRELAHTRTLARTVMNDICASFQHVVIETLIRNALLACRRHRCQTLLVGGGVSANQALRSEFQTRFRREGLKVLFPPKGLSLDNAAMVAGLGYRLYQKGIRSSLELSCEPLGAR